MKSARKAIHKNNSKTINRHYSRNSQRTFENQHHNLLYWTYTSPDEYEAVSVSDSIQLLGIVSLIFFCGNGAQPLVTTSTSFNTQSPTQANLLVRFEQGAEVSPN